MNVAGQLGVLTPDQMQQVHEAACRLLSEQGVAFEADEAVETFRAHGFSVQGNVVYPDRRRIEELAAQAPRTFVLEAPDPAKSVVVGGPRMLVHPNGGEVFVLDHGGARRAAARRDFAELQVLYQALGNVDIGGYEPVTLSDVDERVRGLVAAYESFRHCDKPLLSPMSLETVAKKEEVLRMYDIGFGRDGYTREHYVTWHIVCPNSPLVYSRFACEGIRVYAEANQPVVVVSAPMTGITAPAEPLACLALSVAEELAGLAYAQLVRPGVPVVVSASLTYGYMRTASWECAHPETALMLAASVQMQREFYGLPSRAQTGVTSSKAPDYQAGVETMQSLLFTALAGCDVTSQSVGSLANLMTSSLEKTVLDDEAVARVRLLCGGLEFSPERFCLDQIAEEGRGGDFLAREETIEYCRAAWEPDVSDWSDSDTWEARGRVGSLERAHERVRQILDDAPETLLDERCEAEMADYIAYVAENG